MKKISHYILALLILSSCSSRRYLGTYFNNKEVDSLSTNVSRIDERLILKTESYFEYSKDKWYRFGSKNGPYKFEITRDSGVGKYKLKNDSIYLNFQRENFDYNNYAGANLYIYPKPSQNEKAKLEIKFDGISNIKIKYNGVEISASNFDDIAKFEISRDKFPAELVIDFSKSTYPIFKNYVLRLAESTDYYIKFGVPSLTKFEKDMAFPITKNKSEIVIGMMKKVL